MKKSVLQLICALIWFALSGAENVDVAAVDGIDDGLERFCYPDAHKNTRQSCECSNVSEGPWGTRALHIDCSYKDFKTQDVNEVLPLYVDVLDLSWNALDRLPSFASDSLRLLNVMHNNITNVAKSNFAKLSNLRELYLSWNSVQVVEAQAFDSLLYLEVLDLSHNNLQVLPMQIFATLTNLNVLNLSWNRRLNESAGSAQSLDLYTTLGINKKLQTLKLDACGLTSLIIPEQVTLKELHLRRNQFIRVPDNLPRTLTKIDLSENPIENLLSSDTANMTNIIELYLEDMPHLQSIGAGAFEPLTTLQKVSFQNSRRLNSFDASVFGTDLNPNKASPLRTLIFRGTILRSFNATLAPIFKQLTVLDLNGLPLHCDCELTWLRRLPLETNGRCFKPSRLRGRRLSSVPASDFKCDTWPHWLYGIIVLGLIAVCSVGIYLIVMGLRPHRGVTMRRKVGAGSPYARVTIEPNRQENSY